MIDHLFGRLGTLYTLTKRAYYPFRFQILALVSLSFVAGLFESIGINAVIPLLSYLVEDAGPTADRLTNILRSIFLFLDLDFSPKFLLAFIVVMFTARAFMMFCVAYVQARISSEYARVTKDNLFSSILRSSWPHLMEERLGRLETMLMADVPSSESLLRHLSNAITLGTSIVIFLGVAFTISPLVMGITLILGLTVIICSKPVLRKIRALGTERVALNENTTHLVTESMLGMKTVKSSGVEEHILVRAQNLFLDFKRIFIKVTLSQQIIQLVTPPLGILYIALIFGVAYRTAFISVAALPAIFYLIYRIFLYLQQAQESLQRVNDLLPHLQKVISFTERSHLAHEKVEGIAFSFSRVIDFRDVSFRYSNDGDYVLKKVSFSVPHGSFIGLIGPSGSGKTTCIDLLLRLLTPTEGLIAVDGVPSHKISLDEWRKKIAYVSQDIFLTNDTIAENVRFYDARISDKDVEDALYAAHLKEVVDKSEKGIHTVVGERGLKFSAGQRQRIAIARALARKPEVLILDEATSALDAESEAQIKRIIEELKGKITIVAVAHRLSTIMGADTLIGLEHGQVVEIGTPDSLRKDEASYFSKVSALG